MPTSKIDKQLIAHDRRKWLVLLALLATLLVLVQVVRNPHNDAKTPRLVDPVTNLNAVPNEEIVFNGQGFPNSTIELVANGDAIGSTRVGQDGSWQLRAAFAEEGTYAIAANGMTSEGNVFSASRAITVAVAEPTVIVPTPTSTPAPEPPTLIQPNYVYAGDIILQGQAEPNSSLALYINGEAADTIEVAADGTWAKSLNLLDDDYEIYVVMLDADGDLQQSSAPIELSLDVNPNDYEIRVDRENGDLLAGDIDIAGLSAPNAPVQVLVNDRIAGETRASDSGRWGTTLNLDPGIYLIKVYALDEDENPFLASEEVRFRVVNEDGIIPTATPTPEPEATEAPEVESTSVPENTPAAEDSEASAEQPPASSTIGDAPPTTVPIDCTLDENHGRDFGTYWRVGECDTLFYISRETGIPVLDIQAANTWVQNFDFIVPGWELTLPGR